MGGAEDRGHAPTAGHVPGSGMHAAMDRMTAVEEPAMTPEEIAEELHAMRTERRGQR